MSLYYLYEKSPKRLIGLKTLGAVMEAQVDKPAQTQGTRWVQHKVRAYNVLVTSYEVIVSE